MFKYQLKFLITKEVIDSDFKYQFPHTAEKGAQRFLEDAVRHVERSLDEKVQLKIFRQGSDYPITHMNGKVFQIQFALSLG